MATRTESRSDTTQPIDLLTPGEGASLLVAAQCEAAKAVRSVEPLIVDAARLMADTV